MNWRETIHQLETLGSEQIPEARVKQLIGAMRGKALPLPRVTINAGRMFYRIRPVASFDEVKTPADLSFKPAHLNTTGQRASLRGKTMFYAVLADGVETRTGCLMEACACLREENPSTEDQRVVIGTWQSNCTLDLYAVVSPEMGANRSAKLRKVAENMESFVRNNGGVFEPEEILALQRFLFGQFNQRVQDQSGYFISAYFTDLIMRSSLDGILYESAQSEDPGLKDVLCVALRPEMVEENFVLVTASDHILSYDQQQQKRVLRPATEHIFLKR